MAEAYGWTLDYINSLSVWVVKRLCDAAGRLNDRRRPDLEA